MQVAEIYTPGCQAFTIPGAIGIESISKRENTEKKACEACVRCEVAFCGRSLPWLFVLEFISRVAT